MRRRISASGPFDSQPMYNPVENTMVMVLNETQKNAGSPPEWVHDGARTSRHSNLQKAPKTPNHLRIATLNVGTMTGRGSKLTKQLLRRRIDACAVQETRWKGSGVYTNLGSGYELLYHGTTTRRNGVGVILSPQLRPLVCAVHRWTDRLMAVTLLIGRTRATILSAYAPQVGCNDREKDEFWELITDRLDNTLDLGDVYICGDLNGHVGQDSNGFTCHGNHGYSDRNEEGERLLDFAESRHLFVCNTNFIKQDSHLVTFASGNNKTQIDYIIVPQKNRRLVTNIKVYPDSCDRLQIQHRLLVADILVPLPPKRLCDRTTTSRVKWWRLNEEDRRVQFSLDAKLPLVSEDINRTWNELEKNVMEVAKKHLGVTKPGKPYIDRQTWLWTPAVKAAIEKKKTTYQQWKASRSPDDRAMYVQARTAARKTVTERKEQHTAQLYEDLEKPGGDRLLFRLTKRRARAKEDLQKFFAINDENGCLLTEPTKVTERWRCHFNKIANVEFPHPCIKLPPPISGPIPRITEDEVKEAVWKMKNGKACGPDDVPADFWKLIGSRGIAWLTDIFNKIVNQNKMPARWSTSTTVPIFKKKGSPTDCANYRPIRLLSHTMKILERVIDSRLRAIVNISPQQCGFVRGKSTSDAIFATRQLIEKFSEKKAPLHLAFLDLEKAFDRTPHAAIEAALRAHEVPEALIDVIRLMYRGTTSEVRSIAGTSHPFPIKVGVHQGSALSPLLFILVVDWATRSCQRPAPWTLLYADDVMIAHEKREDLQRDVQLWKDTLAAIGLRLNVNKTEYLEIGEQKTGSIKVDGQDLPKSTYFKYLGSTLQHDGLIKKEVETRIAAMWSRWRCSTGVMCDRRVKEEQKGRLYKAAIRPAALYGCETWPTSAATERRFAVTETRILRWSLGYTLLDHVPNTKIRKRTGVAPIADKMREQRLRWFGHVYRADDDAVAKSGMQAIAPGRRPAGRPKLRYQDTLSRDMEAIGLRPSLAGNRQYWRSRTTIADS
uniref:Reverse transcriptase domain-containing protein n=1 Tax=Plectus sambesii TaxID=2011161 RepID=A0A914US57_9BILA